MLTVPRGTVRLVVDARVRVIGELPPRVDEDLRALCEHPNPGRDYKRRLGIPGWWAEPRTFVTWRRTRGGGLSLPRGRLQEAQELLRGAGVAWEFADARKAPPWPGAGRLEHRVPLYDYQREAADELLARETGILKAGTGSGKTEILLALAAATGQATLVLVPSGALVEQWLERAESSLGLPRRQVGVLRGSKRELRFLTVALVHAARAQLRREPGALDGFGAVLVDEVHGAAADTVYEVVDPLPARYRIGASADHTRKDGKTPLVHDLFGAVAVDVKRRRLEAGGYVLPVEVRAVPTGHAAAWYGPGGDGGANIVRLVKELAADGARNEVVVACALAEVGAGEQAIVLAHEREHCLMLARMLAARGVPVGHLLGGADHAAEFARSIAGLRSGALKVGVGTYKALGTGVDLPAVSAAVCATPIASGKQFFGQVRGRVCRTAPGKDSARLYYPLDEFLVDERGVPSHLKNLVRWNGRDRVVVADGAGGWVPADEWVDRAARGARRRA